MAKDDYDVIVFKILTYLYAVLKGKEVFTKDKYYLAIGKKNIDEQYLHRIYKLMSDEGLVDELAFTRAWGSVVIPLFSESDMMITAKGIHYLEENDKMKAAGRFLSDKADIIISLIEKAGLGLLIP